MEQAGPVTVQQQGEGWWSWSIAVTRNGVLVHTATEDGFADAASALADGDSARQQMIEDAAPGEA